jgi:hypothetical protein
VVTATPAARRSTLGPQREAAVVVVAARTQNGAPQMFGSTGIQLISTFPEAAVFGTVTGIFVATVITIVVFNYQRSKEMDP